MIKIIFNKKKLINLKLSSFFTTKIVKIVKTVIKPYIKIVIPTFLVLLMLSKDIFKYIIICNIIYSIYLGFVFLLNYLLLTINVVFYVSLSYFYDFNIHLNRILKIIIDFLNNNITEINYPSENKKFYDFIENNEVNNNKYFILAGVIIFIGLTLYLQDPSYYNNYVKESMDLFTQYFFNNTPINPDNNSIEKVIEKKKQ